MIPSGASPLSSREELAATLRLAWPLAIAFGGDQVLGVVDSLVAGRMGAVGLAAVGVGNAIFMGVTILGIGVIGAVEPLASQAFGAGRPALARRAYRSAIAFTFLATLPFMFALDAVAELVTRWGELEPETKRAVLDYLLMRSLSILPVFLATAARSYLQSKGDTAAIVWSTVIANILNVPLSIILGFGDGVLIDAGLPGVGLTDGLGVAGLGLASTLVSIVRFVVLWHRIARVTGTPAPKASLWAGLPTLMKVGWAIGLHWFIEVGIFVTVTVLAGRLGTQIVAAHQVALQLSTVTFCICLGLSSAATVRVGYAVGSGRKNGVRRAGLTAVGAAAVFMLMTAMVFSALPETLAKAFSSDAVIISTAAELLRIVAVFQVADGIQAVMGGALRGMGHTRSPMIFNAVGHWCFGLPLGLFLCFEKGLGAVGLWWGLTLGLVFAAVTLTWRFLVVSKRAVRPLEFTADDESGR